MWRIIAIVLCLGLSGCDFEKFNNELFALPKKPLIPQEIVDFIWQEETGGFAYYQKHTRHLIWPKGFSGVSASGFYDAGYYSRTVILSDWQKLRNDWLIRFANTAGITGSRAGALIPALRDITVEWELGREVFDNVFIPQFYELTKRTYPGFEELDPIAQGILVGIVSNRGSSLAGPRRIEMRNIKDLVPKKDYKGMAREVRKMKRLWENTGQNGLLKRREKEAQWLESIK